MTYYFVLLISVFYTKVSAHYTTTKRYYKCMLLLVFCAFCVHYIQSCIHCTFLCAKLKSIGRSEIIVNRTVLGRAYDIIRSALPYICIQNSTYRYDAKDICNIHYMNICRILEHSYEYSTCCCVELFSVCMFVG